jgi:uncharacterized membrane protein YkvA (DUF1232 family)
MNEPSGFKSARIKAESVVKDISKLTTLLHNAVTKADKNKSILKKVWDDLATLFRLIHAWVSGKYRDVPWQTIVFATAAIVYFVNPFDLIPDPIPFLGFLDDSSVIGFVLYSISGDIKRFLEWEQTKTERPDPDKIILP